MINHIKKQADEIEQMRYELENYKQKLEDHSRDTDLLKQLYDDFFIDIDGNQIRYDKSQRFTWIVVDYFQPKSVPILFRHL